MNQSDPYMARRMERVRVALADYLIDNKRKYEQPDVKTVVFLRNHISRHLDDEDYDLALIELGAMDARGEVEVDYTLLDGQWLIAARLK